MNHSFIQTKDKDPEPNYTLFVGNPGAGKSTLQNAIIEKVFYQSDTNLGKGSTKEASKHMVSPGNYYVDTPGIADVKLGKKPIDEVSTILSERAKYKLIFVILLNGDRVDYDDCQAIKEILLLLKKITNKIIPYSIVFNKLSPNVISLITKDINDLNSRLHSYFNKAGLQLPPSDRIFLIPHNKIIDDVDGVEAHKILGEELIKNLKEFIDRTPFFTLENSEETNEEKNNYNSRNSDTTNQQNKQDKQNKQSIENDIIKFLEYKKIKYETRKSNPRNPSKTETYNNNLNYYKRYFDYYQKYLNNYHKVDDNIINKIYELYKSKRNT